jgi:hypothetical protein
MKRKNLRFQKIHQMQFIYTHKNGFRLFQKYCMFCSRSEFSRCKWTYHVGCCCCCCCLLWDMFRDRYVSLYVTSNGSTTNQEMNFQVRTVSCKNIFSLLKNISYVQIYSGSMDIIEKMSRSCAPTLPDTTKPTRYENHQRTIIIST